MIVLSKTGLGGWQK